MSSWQFPAMSVITPANNQVQIPRGIDFCQLCFPWYLLRFYSGRNVGCSFPAAFRCLEEIPTLCNALYGGALSDATGQLGVGVLVYCVLLNVTVLRGQQGGLDIKQEGLTVGETTGGSRKIQIRIANPNLNSWLIRSPMEITHEYINISCVNLPSLSSICLIQNIYFHLVLLFWIEQDVPVPLLMLSVRRGVSLRVAEYCRYVWNIVFLTLEHLFYALRGALLQGQHVHNSVRPCGAASCVEFARAQVVSLVWVCGNILWDASSSKAFYKAEAVAV